MPGLRLPRELTKRFGRGGGRPEEWFRGPLQARILRTLTDRGEISVRELIDAQSGLRRSHTVMTVLRPLCDRLTTDKAK